MPLKIAVELKELTCISLACHAFGVFTNNNGSEVCI